MSTHNIGFYEDLTKIIFELSSNTKFLINVKLVLISDTYCIFILAIRLLLPHKKEQTDPGTSLDRVDSDLDSKAQA